MKAIVSETEIHIIPEDANEEYALRQWNKAHGSCPKIRFVLEVQEKPEANHGHRYGFDPD